MTNKIAFLVSTLFAITGCGTYATGYAVQNINQVQNVISKSGGTFLTGHGEPSKDLGNDQDVYLDLDNDNLYKKEDSVWNLVCNIQGMKGDTGTQGEQGVKGDTGTQGVKGDTGTQGEQGSKGDTGSQGEQGSKGDTGTQGETGPKGDTGEAGSSFLTGSSDPTVNEGKVGDTYMNSTTGDMFSKTESGWQKIGNLNLSENYTVNFHVDDSIISTVNVKEGQRLTAPDSSLLPSTYSLKNWYLLDNGTKQNWNFSDYTYRVFSDLDLYADYEINYNKFLDFTYDSVNMVASVKGKEADKLTLTSISIPSTIKYNGDSYKVTTISASAFCYFEVLKTVDIPSSVQIIGDSAFSNTAIENLSFPDDSELNKFGMYAFGNCDSLKTVSLPKSIQIINDYAFGYSKNITSYSISSENPYFTTSDGIIFNKDSSALVFYPANKKGTSYQVPNSVKTLNDTCFWGSNNLQSVIIPDSVTEIGWYAFKSSALLTSVSLSQYVTKLGSEAFNDCPLLNMINIDSNNTLFSSIDGVVFNKAKTKLLIYPSGRVGEYVIPSSVTELGGLYQSAISTPFKETHKITKVTIPNSVTSITDECFSSSENLKTIVLPDNLVSIPGYFAYMTYSLVTIVFPETLTSIGASAFSICTSLTKVSFKGTKAKWNAISKGENYNHQSFRTVHCTDGDIEL